MKSKLLKHEIECYQTDFFYKDYFAIVNNLCYQCYHLVVVFLNSLDYIMLIKVMENIKIEYIKSILFIIKITRNYGQGWLLYSYLIGNLMLSSFGINLRVINNMEN